MEEEIVLQEGRTYSNKEMAEWFDITERSFSKMKTKKLKELEEYAEFETMRGKVKILKLKDPDRITYDNHLTPIKRYVAAHFLETWDTEGIETASRVAAKLCVAYRKEKGVPPEKAKERSFLYCVKKERDKHFPMRSREWAKMFGTVGKCDATVYTRAKNMYESLNDEQAKEFYEEFYKRYKKDKVATAIMQINSRYEKGELQNKERWEEAWKEFNETTGADEQPYVCFLKEMAEKYECDWMISGTKAEEQFAF